MDTVTTVDALKDTLLVALAAVTLLAACGSTQAAGNPGGTIGLDAAGLPGPVLAGKLGGSGAADEFQLADPDDGQGGAIVLGGKLGVATGEG